MNDENRSFEICTQVEVLLGELATLWDPDEVLEYVDRIAERMRAELEETA